MHVHDTTRQGVLFENLAKKAVIAKFDQDHASSDGGAVLPKACDERLELSAALAACLADNRQQSKVPYSLRELFQLPMFSIACGYADSNDAARLSADSVMKLLTGRDPIKGTKHRKGGRAVECNGLENRRSPAGIRGFESPPFLHSITLNLCKL